MRRSAIPLVLLAALSFFAGLGRGAITDADEAFYAESAREMVESGDWLTPHYNFEPRFQKPALYYWLTAATYLATGPTELAARLWSAIAGIGLVLITAACGRRWFDDATGLLAGAIAATSFGYFALARMALPDLPLAFFITLAIWSAFVATLEYQREPRRWLLLSGAAMALGFLMKGPLALIIPALVVVPVLLLERRSFNVRAADVVLAALLFLAIALPWYIAMWWQHGTEYVRGFFIGDNFERFATTRFNDPRPWWFYLPVMLGGVLPWTALMLVWVAPVAQFLTRRRDVGTLDLRLLMWAVLPLIFFTLSIGKQPRYILPILPPVAILLASSVIERTREWRSLDGARRRPRPSLAVVSGCVLAGAFMIALGAMLYRAHLLFIDVGDQLSIGAAAATAVSGAAVIIVALSSAWRAAPGVLAFGAAVMFAVLPFGVMPAPHDATVQQMARHVRAAYTGEQAVATYGVFVRNLVFYTHIRHTDLIHDEHVADWLAKHPRALIVLPEEHLTRLEKERGLTFRRLSELRYFDDGGIKVRTILWPDVERDLSRVYLVATP